MKVEFLENWKYSEHGYDIIKAKVGDIKDIDDKDAKIWIGAKVVKACIGTAPAANKISKEKIETK